MLSRQVIIVKNERKRFRSAMISIVLRKREHRSRYRRASLITVERAIMPDYHAQLRYINAQKD